MALVLNMETGLVSPQFHVSFDSSFATVRNQLATPVSKWQVKAEFVSQREQQVMAKGKEDVDSRKRKRQEQPIAKDKGKESWYNRRADREVEPTEKDKPVTQFALQPEPITVPEGGAPLESPVEEMVADDNQPQRDDNRPTNPDGGAVPEQPSRRRIDGRPTRARRRVRRLIEVLKTEISETTSHDVVGEIFCLQAMYPDAEQPSGGGTQKECPLYAYKATSDPDTMYLHQAMKEPDKGKFVEAMQKEVDDQMNNGNFSLKRRDKIPKGKTILRAVWQMKRKRHIKTRQVKKWKA